MSGEFPNLEDLARWLAMHPGWALKLSAVKHFPNAWWWRATLVAETQIYFEEPYLYKVLEKVFRDFP